MHATTVLQELLAPVFSTLDQRNARNLMSAVCACLAGRRLGLLALARHWPGALRVAALPKPLDRLLSNRAMHAARRQIYDTAVAWLLRQSQRVVLASWTEATATAAGMCCGPASPSKAGA